jgi:hypothetical protein
MIVKLHSWKYSCDLGTEILSHDGHILLSAPLDADFLPSIPENAASVCQFLSHGCYKGMLVGLLR